MTLRLVHAAAVALAALSSTPGRIEQAPLGPTVHPALPREASALWLVPSQADRQRYAADTGLAAAVRRLHAGDAPAALAALARVGSRGPLADYVDYYRGVTLLRLGRLQDAEAALASVAARKPQGAVAGLAALARGEIAEASGDHRAAVSLYRAVSADPHLVNEDVLSRLGRAALAAGDRKTAAEAYVRIYYEFALTDAATTAASHLHTLKDQIVRTGYQADLGRAAMLFGARRYAEARAAYQDLRSHVDGDDRELADLRIAESDYHLKRYAAARDGLQRYLQDASRKAEAQFFYLSALRELGRHDEYLARTRALVAAFPDSSWAEDALNALGTHYILAGDDEAAARTFAELYQKFPGGRHAERAAWKSGWWSYRRGDYRTAIATFESAAASFPRSNYRPSFLYWAARAHGRLGATQQASARYRIVREDYGNSYYGRLAERRVADRGERADSAARAVRAAHRTISSETPRVPTEERIRLLLAHGLYDDALAELRHAQRQWGTSPAIEATIAWVHHTQGDLRRAITLMRRAYPQSLTADGHELPVEIRQVIFPLVYWDLIRKHAAARDLDPYMIAALVAQESTFQPDARSVANAWGLMQILPSTGRRLAQSLGIRPFSIRTLTTPETNIRLGTLYFSQLSNRFGGAHFALASYNAGENRVVRWKAERPDIETDEFIDDIPFPETQNYVKRILGTAEDYRLLYGRDGGRPQQPASR